MEQKLGILRKGDRYTSKKVPMARRVASMKKVTRQACGKGMGKTLSVVEKIYAKVLSESVADFTGMENSY